MENNEIKQETVGRYVSIPDDELVRICSEAVTAFCKERHLYWPIDESACRSKAGEAFKNAYRHALGYKRHDSLKQEHLWDMNDMYQRLQGRIHMAVREIVLKYTAGQKTLAIKKTSGAAAMDAALQGAGFSGCIIQCQCHRVKATVRTKRYSATIVVSYKDIIAGKLDAYMREFKESLVRLEAAPYQVKICK